MSNRAVLTGIQGNRGDHARLGDIMDALEGLTGGRKRGPVDFATLCEMKSEPETVAYLRRSRDWNVVDGGHGTILVTNAHTMGFVKPDIIHLLPEKRRMGIHNMAKDAVGGVFHHKPSNRLVRPYAGHNIQSLWMPGRRGPGRAHNQHFVDQASGYAALTIYGADHNDKWTGRSMEPFRNAGWEHSPLLPTHKQPHPKRAIDFFCVDDRNAGAILGAADAEVIDVKGTDHGWYRCSWPILVRAQ